MLAYADDVVLVVGTGKELKSTTIEKKLESWLKEKKLQLNREKSDCRQGKEVKEGGRVKLRRGEYKRNKRVQILIMLKTGRAVEQGSNGESVGNWEKGI